MSRPFEKRIVVLVAGFVINVTICLMVCPDVAIFRKDESFMIDYDYCKGCGICAVECPRSVITIEDEDSLRSNTL